MEIIDAIRTLELVSFERNGRFVLFHPETLCFFRLNRPAAGLVQDLRQGMSEPELLDKYRIGRDELGRCLAPIFATIRRQGRPLSQTDPGSLLKRSGLLPKAVLMVNNYCNLKCTYCYEHQSVFTKKAIDMPAKVARAAIDKIYRAFEGVGTWMFIGGEPTLSEDVLDFSCRYATEVAQRNGVVKPSFGMISNGVKMTGRLFDIICEFEIQVTFSLDGPKKVNDLVRIRHDNTGTFDGVVENIKRYREVLPDKIQVECTVTQAHMNAGFSLAKVLDFCANDLGVEEPHIAAAGLPAGNPLNPYQSGSAIQEDFLAAAEASMDNLLNGGAGSRKGGRLDVVASMVNRLAHRDPKPIMCPAGTTQIVVDAFGDIYPCWMFAGSAEHAMGNILRDEIRGPKALQVIDRIESNSKIRNPVCSTCYARSVCSACVGNNHNASGKLEEPAPEFCDSVRGTLRVVLERLAAASGHEAAAAANGLSGALKC
jgi:uncharacterized protein